MHSKNSYHLIGIGTACLWNGLAPTFHKHDARSEDQHVTKKRKNEINT